MENQYNPPPNYTEQYSTPTPKDDNQKLKDPLINKNKEENQDKYFGNEIYKEADVAADNLGNASNKFARETGRTIQTNTVIKSINKTLDGWGQSLDGFFSGVNKSIDQNIVSKFSDKK